MSAAPAVDVVIVGAGAAGALLAQRLAAAGKSVVVLDAGPAWKTDDLISSQIWSRRLRWGGAFVESGGPNPIGFGFNAGWGFGGAALHHYGTWPRLHEEDFRMRTLYGKGRDWPIDYDMLRPFYDALQTEVGLSGDAAAEVWRPAGAPYPMPPLTVLAQGQAIARGFDKLGIRTAPVPMAINSVEYQGRPACIYDGWCDAGCPIGALANPLVLHIPQAIEKGARFVAHARVTRVLMSDARRAQGVEFVDAQGVRREQAAAVVVLAASVAHVPQILLNSTSDAHPQGLGNGQDQVGRGLMTHSLIPVFGIFDDETEPHLGVSAAQLTSRDGYKKDGRAGMFGSYQWLIAPSMKPNDLPGLAIGRADIFGRKLDAFMKRAAKHGGNMLAMGEELPDPDNRVTLSTRAGPLGTREPKFTHTFSNDALALVGHMKAEGKRIFEAAGATEIGVGGPNTAHLMGGTAMGEDPATSVTDAQGRIHGIENVIIAGPGLFPTGAAVNPTYTMMAIASRQAQDLVARWPG